LFSFGLPFFTLLLLLVAVYRGFDRADVKVYFSDVLKNLLFILFLGVSVLFRLSFVFVLSGFVLSLVVSCVGIIILLLKRPPTAQTATKAQHPRKVTKELLIFSLPLLVSALFSIILSWTDTIAVGYFKGVIDVGIYNAALPIAMFVPILLNGMAYIYLPVVTKLRAQNRLDEIKRMYVITTKWIFSLTYPLFLVLVLFPKPVLGFLFGVGYVVGTLALQILVIGFFIHTFLGLNASTLLSLGETKYLMGTSIVASLVNIALNVVLVPRMGIVGAAVATSLSLVLLNILISSKCYLGYRIHPFTRKYLSPILVSIPAVLIVYTITKLLVVEETIWLLPILLVIFFVIYFVSLLLTRGFDREDLTMIVSIERKLGVDFKNVKKILKRFL
ncbi:MAG: flippase, partial [Thermoplasmata archaeon]